MAGIEVLGDPLKQGSRSNRRDVGDKELGGSGIDEALDVDRLSEGRLDDIVRGGGVDNVVGAAPYDEQSLIVDSGRGGEIVGDLLANIVDVDG